MPCTLVRQFQVLQFHVLHFQRPHFVHVLLVCCLQDNKVHVYSLAGNMLHEKTVMEHTGAVTSLKYSPDGSMLAASDTNRKVLLYQLPDYTVCHLLKHSLFIWQGCTNRGPHAALDRGLCGGPQGLKEVTIICGPQ